MRTSSYSLVLLALWMCACESESQLVLDAPVVQFALSGDVLAEEHAGGSIIWQIATDGEVKALAVADRALESDVSGSLLWGEEKKKVPLAFDAKTGLLVAAAPNLTADLTQIFYSLSIAGETWSGVLHMPRGGTAELVANAGLNAGFEGKRGPHGGLIQVVGPDIFEIFAIEGIGKLRVSLLDANLKVAAMGERKITVAVETEAGVPRVATLAPEWPGAHYATGRPRLKGDPLRLTLVVRHGEGVSVALVGFKPGLKLKVGDNAPRLNIHVKKPEPRPNRHGNDEP